MRLVWVEREWGVGNVGLVCGLFGAGRCGSGHGVRTTRLESASCHIRVGSVWVEQERFASSGFEASDVLDAETVGIEPGKEDVTDNILDSFFRELKSLGSDDGTVTEV